MALFKKKVPYTDYVGDFVAALINTAQKDIALADTDNILGDNERQKIADTLLPFSLVILLLELTNTAHAGKNPTIPRNAGPEDVNRLVSRHFTELLGPIYVQMGKTEQEYKKLIDTIMDFLVALENAPEDDMKKGADFIVTNYFSTYILGKQDFSSNNENQRMRHFVTFDMAMQVCKNTQAAYRNYSKDFAIASN